MLVLAVQERLDERTGTAGRVARGQVGDLADGRVGVDLAATRETQTLDRADQGAVVHEFEVGLFDGGCEAPVEPQAALASGVERGFDRVDPVRRVGVTVDVCARVVLERDRVGQVQHRSSF